MEKLIINGPMNGALQISFEIHRELFVFISCQLDFFYISILASFFCCKTMTFRLIYHMILKEI